jgi:putative membrane protein
LVDIVIRIVINAVALALAIKLVPNVAFTGDWPQLIGLAIVFGIVNGLIRPVVKLLSLPLTIVTFGLIGFVINTAMVMLAAWLGDKLGFSLTLGGWPADRLDLDAIIAALLVSIVISIVSAVVAFTRRLVPGT